MATELEILDLRALLSEDSASDPAWTDGLIGERIDSQTRKSEIVLLYWRQRAAKTANLVSISENGSTRNLESIHKNAMAQVEYWAGEVEREKTEEEEAASDEPRTRIRFHRVTRV